ncbi:MAG: NAD-dependent epimerase/dehydratase family protein, partial [Gammaproteobacteria bacterium]|nr:NAD-dependent epimerase/dehydratase family protein [Gammaproteobacteria bacterium]
VTLWGTGNPMREFLYISDLADAVVWAMKHYNDPEIINVGSGVEVSIRELSEMVALEIGYRGEIVWDHSKPDGTPRKILDCSKIHSLGWKYQIPLRYGLKLAYRDYVEQLSCGALPML